MAGLYVHIPFCRTKCHYCDFCKSLDTGMVDSFIEAISKEIDLQRDYLEGESIETIYFGGGTPSLLDSRKVRIIIERLRSGFAVSEGCEITIEVNPDDVVKYYFDGLKREGINRLSIGIQSWEERILKMLNRRHNAEQAERAVEDAIKSGFENINVDLIYGIPGLSSEDWRKNLKKTFFLDIQHLSAYHLTIEPNTLFGKMLEAGELSEINEEESENQFNILVESAASAGFIHYEISNLCKEGYYSRHNTNYWKQVKYLGLGPSAHSYDGYSRQWNEQDLGKYLSSLSENKIPFQKEILDTKAVFNEYIMTNLRTIWGVDFEHVENIFSKEAHDYLYNIAVKYVRYGMLEINDHNHLVLTNQGKMISDNIISELMMD